MKTDRVHPELCFFVVLLGLLNLHLIPGVEVEPQRYHVAAVAGGEWWRLVTFAFVHVSWYHLLLDAVAFVMLYTALDVRMLYRLLYLGASIAGSLIASLWLEPRVLDIGLCGLSGAAHGLMAVVGLEWLARTEADSALRWMGGVCFAVVLTKSLFELVTGHMLFESFQLGPIGTPIAVSHLGGLLGAGLAFLCLRGPRFRAGSSPAFSSTSSGRGG